MANLKKRITINIFLLSLISAIFVGCIENRPIKNIVYLNEKLTQSLIDGKEVELDIEVDTTCMNDLILCAKLKQDHRFSKIRYIPFNVNLKWEGGKEYIYIANIPLESAIVQNRAIITQTKIATNIPKEGNGVIHLKLSLLNRSKLYENLLSLGVKSEKTSN